MSRSSMKSEPIAGSLASAKGIWLNKLGNDFHIKFTPIPILTDNQSTIAYSKNKVNNSETKYIDIHYHYRREQIIAGNIKLIYIKMVENPADVLTKLLSPCKHLCILQ